MLLLTVYCNYSQKIVINGTLKNFQNKGIYNASVSILNENDDFLGYKFSDKDGLFSIIFEPPKKGSIKIEISCLGYKKISQIIDRTSQNQIYKLEESIESLNEVVIESEKKIKIDRDTTYIKVANFGNKTEQTVEDILKKLPGIVVLKDGSIKAHGKYIDKLLVEGEDIFDKNYKLLSKNLDAKVLDEVQILDNFEDNPILKKINNSNKVAINLKLKKGLTNVWFGNINLGSGVVSCNRWKENVNLGLLKKKMKLFYFADYNNLGEKATDIIKPNSIETSNFGSSRIEYKAKNLFFIANNEMQFFSKTQSIFNNGFLNSFSFTSKIKKNLITRGLFYFADDNQFQNSTSITKYNLLNNSVLFTEDNFYTNKNRALASEIEFKYSPNNKNYITNLFVLKNNPNVKANQLLYNNEPLNQITNTNEVTIYNHFNHTRQLSEKTVLINYFYLGVENINEQTKIESTNLNNFLNINSNEIVTQNANNKLFNVGIQSKIITKFKNLDISNSLHFEYKKEIFKNDFIANSLNILQYQNDINLQQTSFFQENTLRYNFSKKIDLTSNLNFQNSRLEYNSIDKSLFLLNPSIFLNFKKTGFGNFSFSFTETNSLPEINQLTTNFQLTDYRSFTRGTNFQNNLKNQTTSFNYIYFNDEKRFSINSDIFYTNSKIIFNSLSNLTNDFNFTSYIQSKGGESYNFNFSFINYFRKFKVASKIETINNWTSTPINVNSTGFSTANNYSNSIKYSAITYFKLPINFDGGFSYNYNQSLFENKKTNNITKDFFLNINSTILKIIVVECNNSMYFFNNQIYSFNNLILNVNPQKSRLSYRLIFNNILNENKYTFISLNNYTFYQSSVALVPRYLLFTAKYRF